MRAIVLVALLLVSCTSAAAPGASPSLGLSGPSSAPPSPTIGQVATASPLAQPPASGVAPTPIPLPSSADVAAAGNGVVWTLVAGTHLFRSLDFGATWEERALPTATQIKTISFVDDRNGWVLSLGSAASGCMGQSFAILRTTDAAQTWQKVFESDRVAISPGCKSALAFVDTTHGFVTVSGRDVAPQILRSVDGGVTWASSPRLPDPPGFRFEPSVSTLAPGAVADFGTVLLVSAFAQAGPDVRRHVYRSTDGGATWSYVVAAPTSSDIVFLTPTRWLQIVPNSSSETTDAGASWHTFSTDYGQAAPVAPQIVFGDVRTGYATVRGGIQRTVDGGVHWTGIVTPGTRAAP